MRETRLVLRQLRKAPLFLGTAVVTLALGVAVNAALLRSLLEVYRAPAGIREPHRLSQVQIVQSRDQSRFAGLPGEDFALLEESLTTVEAIGGYRLLGPVNLTWEKKADLVSALAVTPTYFEVLGIVPRLGSLLRADRPSDIRRLVLSHALWRAKFEGDSAIVGQKVEINKEPFTVAAVAGPGFKGVNRLGDPQVMWLPVTALGLVDRTQIVPRKPEPEEKATGRDEPGLDAPAETRPTDTPSAEVSLEVIARLREHLEHAELEQELDVLSPRLRGLDERELAWIDGLELRARPMAQTAHGLRRDQEKGVLLLLGAGGLVLFLTCANLANLFLARGLQRSGELSVRRTLGASFLALLRLQLTEGAVVALIAGLLSVPLSTLVVRQFWSLRPPLVSSDALDLGSDLRLMAVAMGISLLTLVAFAIFPSVVAIRRSSLRASATGEAVRTTAQRWLVASQIAIAVVVLIGASLAISSLRRLRAVPLGFDPHRLLMYSYDFSRTGDDESKVSLTMTRLLEAVRNHAQVEAASFSTMHYGMMVIAPDVVPDGWDDPEGMAAAVNGVTEDHFECLGIPILYGRGFSEADRAGSANVAIVSRSFADRAWPGESAIGHRVLLLDRYREVIGVVTDSKLRRVNEGTWMQVYYPLAQAYASRVALNVRARVDGERVAHEIADLLAATSPQHAFDRGRWSSWVDGSLWAPRVASSLLGGLGLIALLLAATGLYSTLSLWVVRRHGELAIRLAVGAAPRDLILMILRSAIALSLAGLAIGIPAAAVLSRLSGSLLFGVSPTEPSIYLGVGILLLATAGLGGIVPALRARTANPLSLMRPD